MDAHSLVLAVLLIGISTNVFAVECDLGNTIEGNQIQVHFDHTEADPILDGFLRTRIIASYGGSVFDA
jgi:3D (Asp-Asp-Asp) domain-containing protein